MLLLENIGTSLKVGPNQLASLHKLLIEASHILQMPPPDLYIRQVRINFAPVSSIGSFCYHTLNKSLQFRTHSLAINT